MRELQVSHLTQRGHNSGPATALRLPGSPLAAPPALPAALPGSPGTGAAPCGGVWCRHSTFKVPLISSCFPGTPSHTLVPHARPRVPSCRAVVEREVTG